MWNDITFLDNLDSKSKYVKKVLHPSYLTLIWINRITHSVLTCTECSTEIAIFKSIEFVNFYLFCLKKVFCSYSQLWNNETDRENAVFLKNFIRIHKFVSLEKCTYTQRRLNIAESFLTENFGDIGTFGDMGTGMISAKNRELA